MNRAKERRYRARVFADAIPISKDAVGVLIGSVQLMPFTWMMVDDDNGDDSGRSGEMWLHFWMVSKMVFLGI